MPASKWKLVALEDLKGLSEAEIKDHIAREYGSSPYGEIDKAVRDALKGMSVLIAYESVGSWGCDSSSFFLLRDKKGQLWENHGSHCSCYGFEEQWKPEKTFKTALKKQKFFGLGGYDSSPAENRAAIKAAINAL